MKEMLLCSIQASSLSKGCTQDYSRWRQNLTEIVVLKHVIGRESLCSEGLRRSKTLQIMFGTPNLELKTRSQRAVKENIRAYLIRIQILTIKNRVQPCHLSSSIYNGGVRTSILILRVLRLLATQRSTRKVEKMIQAVLHGEIGGKGVSITKSRPATACEFPLDSLRK